MNFFDPNSNTGAIAASSPSPVTMPQVEVNEIIKRVYLWMGLGLLTTAFVAWFTATNEALLAFSAQPGVGIISIIAVFGIVIALSFGMQRDWLNPSMAAMMFFAFAAIEGFLLSVVMFSFLAPTLPDGSINPNFNPGALYAAFGTASALFGAMTIVGFTTKMDLSKWGTYLFMGLIGLIIAMVVNMFLGSSTLGFVISVAGVLIFTALTAYDTQKIKEMSMSPQMQGDGNLAMKFSIYGALILYLDLLNLFLFLLQIFGGGRD
jgi:uncharacterized protein